MPFKFNPFSGNFDQTGSGGGGASYIDGEVAAYNDLPLDGTAALNSAWLVRTASGIWPVTRKQAGIYIRTATAGSSRDADYTYAGTMPDVFSDANFVLYDNGDSTKNLQFQLSGITTATTRTLTVPNASGTIARTEDFAAPPAIGNTTRNTVAATTMSATGAITGAVAGTTSATSGCNGFQIPVPAAGGASAVGMYGAFTAGSQRAVIFGAGTSGSTTTLADFSANGLVANSIQNTPIGSTTAAAATFTNLTANTRVNLPNTNGTTAGDIYRNANTLRYRDSTNTERLLLNATDNLSNLADAATARANLGLGTSDNVTFGSIQNTPIGSTTPAAGSFSTLNVTGTTELVNGGTTAGPFRLYNISSAANANYERGFLRWSSNVLQIGTEKGGTGSARPLEFQTDGVTRMTIATTGETVFTQAASFSHNVTVANGRAIGCNQINLNGTSTALLALGTDSTIRWGAPSATAPLLKRSSTTLQVRLANDSDFAPLECAGLTLNGNLTASTRNIVTDTTTGTKIGTDPLQKIGFFDKTPVVRPSAVADATDAASVITQLNALLSRMRDLGLIAT